MDLIFWISLSSEDFGLDLYPSCEQPEDTVTETDFHGLDILDIPLFRGMYFIHGGYEDRCWTRIPPYNHIPLFRGHRSLTGFHVLDIPLFRGHRSRRVFMYLANLFIGSPLSSEVCSGFCEDMGSFNKHDRLFQAVYRPRPPPTSKAIYQRIVL